MLCFGCYGWRGQTVPFFRFQFLFGFLNQHVVEDFNFPFRGNAQRTVGGVQATDGRADEHVLIVAYLRPLGHRLLVVVWEHLWLRFFRRFLQTRSHRRRAGHLLLRWKCRLCSALIVSGISRIGYTWRWWTSRGHQRVMSLMVMGMIRVATVRCLGVRMLVRRMVMVRSMHRIRIVDIAVVGIFGRRVMVHHGRGSISVVLVSGGGGGRRRRMHRRHRSGTNRRWYRCTSIQRFQRIHPGWRKVSVSAVHPGWGWWRS